MGGDAVKVLAWYRPDADAAVNEHQKRFVREIGEDCARHDIPYVLELLVYPFLGSANHTADYVESPGKLPCLVIDSVREFAKPEYGVDLLKLESPLVGSSTRSRPRSRTSCRRTSSSEARLRHADGRLAEGRPRAVAARAAVAGESIEAPRILPACRQSPR